MKSKQEQIEVILSMDTFDWAVKQLSIGESIGNHRYTDFISITPEDIENYVKEHGFSEKVVCIFFKGQVVTADDRICIVETPSTWEVFYTERGHRSEEVSLKSFDEAQQEVIRRLITSAKISLNHRYKNAHPEIHLPLSSEMD